MPFFRKIFKKYDALNNSVQENVGGIRVVKSFVREDYETEKFKKAAGEVRDDFTRAEKILAFNSIICFEDCLRESGSFFKNRQGFSCSFLYFFGKIGCRPDGVLAVCLNVQVCEIIFHKPHLPL